MQVRRGNLVRKVVRTTIVLTACLCAAATAYAATGWIDAARDAGALAERANALIAAGRGGDNLGRQRLAWLLKVEDPAFYDHAGYDLSTPGAGATTVTQALSKRTAFDRFQPGVRKLRQTAYAASLERHLSKDQILALALDTVPLGRGPNGPMVGLQAASKAVYGRSPRAVTDDQFLMLVAVMIAPTRLSLQKPDAAVFERLNRIRRLVADECAPLDHSDVWLDGCVAKG